MTQPSKTLKHVLASAKAHGRRALVVFDLDSTLFDVGPRLEKILLDFAAEPRHQQQFPEQIKFFKNIKVERSDWGVKDALIRSGLDGHNHEFQRAVRDFWRHRFFSNEYLEFDVPYQGAVEYVRQVAAAGADIAYLTGRDVARMGIGSASVLHKWNFPLDEHSVLALKPNKDMDDAGFKTDWFLALPKGKYDEIWLFENEPVNINHMRLNAAHVKMVFLDTTHSRLEKEPEDIPRIVHFLLDEET